MASHGKRYRAAKDKAPKKMGTVETAVPTLKACATAKFDETIEISMLLGVDPKHADQMVRGTVVLPHGLGKSKKVLVIAGPDKQKEAEEAGADHVGGEEMVDKIQGGFMDFDAVVATPDMMRAVGKLGKVLGPRGLMPTRRPARSRRTSRRRCARSRPVRSSSAWTRRASCTRRSARFHSRAIG